MKGNSESKSKPKAEDKGSAKLSWIQKVRQFNIREFYKQRRRLINTVGIAVVLLVAFSWGAFAFTSSPQFCAMCHEPAHATWDTSTHAEVSCVQCHKVSVLRMTYAHFVHTPTKVKITRAVPLDDACLECHSLKREYNPTGDLKVPHREHVTRVKTTTRCVYCHTRTVHAKTAEDRRPQMELCMEKCHDGKKAPERCDLCHTKKAMPEDHLAADWLKAHGALATKQDCKKCHAWRPQWCSECHKKRPDSHAGLWRTFHRNSIVQAGRGGCRACHKDVFCVKCHGFVP